jgi:hypothetical protein
MSKESKINKFIEISRFDSTELLDIQLQTTITNEVKAIKMFRDNPEGMKKVQDFIEQLKKSIMAVARGIVFKELQETFSEKELDELIAIYSNPVFKKLDTRKLTKAAEKAGRELAKKEFPKLEKILSEMEKGCEEK